MILDCRVGAVAIVDEATYTFGSVDNLRRYASEFRSEGCDRPTSIHGVLLNQTPLVVLGACGGATGIHEHSAVVVRDRSYLAVGDHLVCIALPSGAVRWAARVDIATCFGVYHVQKHQALISHGEMEIARLSYNGEILWRASGADIFTEGFELQPGFIETTDFGGRKYRFAYETGNEV